MRRSNGGILVNVTILNVGLPVYTSDLTAHRLEVNGVLIYIS